MNAVSNRRPSVALNFDAMPTLGDITRYHAGRRPEHAAIRFEGRVTSWKALDAGASRVANALTAAGVVPGDRIGYLGKGTDEFFELMFGVAKAGATFVPAQWRLALPEVEQIVRDAGVRCLFLDREQLDKLPALRAVIAPHTLVIAMEGGGTGLPRYQEWRDAAPAGDSATPVDPASVALQLYTS
jgi:long-chain acyl-CoA synthetase